MSGTAASGRPGLRLEFREGDGWDGLRVPGRDGSPLSTGDAGSGESETRRWIFEHDLLEALIALPEQLLHNTGIATYVWMLTDRKCPQRRGEVQLIDAPSFWMLLRKTLGAKCREIPHGKKEDILALLRDVAPFE